MSKYKYNTLLDVAKAFKSGELDKNEYTLYVDNDYSFITWCGKIPDNLEEDSDAAWDYEMAKREECGKWYKGNGRNDFTLALAAAGIPFELC